MGTKSLQGSKRVDALAWDPFALFVVGLDKRPDGTVDGDEHPRWDPRVNMPLDEEMVVSFQRHGRNLQTVTIVDVDGVAEIDDGRQRVRCAREAQRRENAAKSGKTILIYSGLSLRGYSDFDHAVIGQELNSLRTDDDDMTKAEKAAHAMRFAENGDTSRTAIARSNKWTVKVLEGALNVVEKGSAEVKKALREGRITLALAAELAAKPKAEQAPAMAQVATVAASLPAGRKVTRADANRNGVATAIVPSKRTVAKMLEELATVDGRFVADDVANLFMLGALWALQIEIPDGLLDDGNVDPKIRSEMVKAATRLLKKANR